MSLFAVRNVPLDPNEAIAAVMGPEMGGIDVFLGAVRNHADGQVVTLLEYEAYETMAVKQMRRIAESVAADFPGTRLAALHRVGRLSVGELAVVCVAAAPHRQEAFAACRLLIDRIKAEVPVWKREHGPDGPYWVGWRDARCRGDEHHQHHHHAGEHGGVEDV